MAICCCSGMRSMYRRGNALSSLRQLPVRKALDAHGSTLHRRRQILSVLHFHHIMEIYESKGKGRSKFAVFPICTFEKNRFIMHSC